MRVHTYRPLTGVADGSCSFLEFSTMPSPLAGSLRRAPPPGTARSTCAMPPSSSGASTSRSGAPAVQSAAGAPHRPEVLGGLCQQHSSLVKGNCGCLRWVTSPLPRVVAALAFPHRGQWGARRTAEAHRTLTIWSRNSLVRSLQFPAGRADEAHRQVPSAREVGEMSVSRDRRQDVLHGRHGTCHRCGWDQPLRKVTGRIPAEFRRVSGDSLRARLRWLCDECVADLTTAGRDRPAQVAGAHLHLVATGTPRQRSVA
jgi:hypothetical protein